MNLTWDPKKSEKNRKERGKGFEEAVRLFESPFISLKAMVSGEPRVVIFGYIDGKEWMAVFTEGRNPNRVILLRRSSKNERKKYYGQN